MPKLVPSLHLAAVEAALEIRCDARHEHVVEVLCDVERGAVYIATNSADEECIEVFGLTDGKGGAE